MGNVNRVETPIANRFAGLQEDDEEIRLSMESPEFVPRALRAQAVD